MKKIGFRLGVLLRPVLCFLCQAAVKGRGQRQLEVWS